jgi:hypothetical protein
MASKKYAVYNRSVGEHLTVPVVILGPNLPGPTETFHVHLGECGDIFRSRTYAAQPEFAKEDAWEVASMKEMVELMYPADEFDYDPADWAQFVGEFRIFPCVGGIIPDDPIPAPKKEK